MSNAKEKFRVKLKSANNSADAVTFLVAPAVTESQSVQYQSVQPVHSPGAMQVYSTTASRVFSIQPVKLISRNGEEAAKNIRDLNLLRSWTKPYFGGTVFDGDADFNGEIKALGSSPDVLLLSAYGEKQFLGNLVNIPVVLSNLGITYPDDVDYIPCGPGPYYNTPFPVVMQIDLTLMETHSPSEYANKFDLYKYKRGILENF